MSTGFTQLQNNRFFKTLPRKILKVSDHNTTLFICGAALTFCYYPFNLGMLSWFLLFPLIKACHQPDPVTRLKKSFIFSIAYFAFGIYWLVLTLMHQVHFNLAVSIILELVLAAALALAPISFCWLSGYIKTSPIINLLWLPALWIFTEDIRFQAFGGGPWISLGLSQIDTPLAGFFSIIGESGVSGLVVLMAVLIFNFIDSINKNKTRLTIYPIIFITILLLTGQWLKQASFTHPLSQKIPIAMVQPATSQQDKLNKVNPQKRLQLLQQLSLPYLGKTRLVIWPETVITLEKQQIEKSLSTFNRLAIETKTTLLIGAFELGLNQKLFNTAYTKGFEGGQVYRKRHLVPFG